MQELPARIGPTGNIITDCMHFAPRPMRIPFVDLASAYQELQPELDAAYRRVAQSGWYLLGAEVDAFEHEFASYCGARHCVGVGNGLDALRMILIALDIRQGAQVLVPANTFIATWLAVSLSGAQPIPVDATAESGNIDPALIEHAITERTRAIMPVHLYGQPADMDPIREVAEDHGLVVIEDAAQAHGARYKGRITGTLGIAAGFSFHPTKNLGALGDGGAVVTDDDDIAEHVRALRNYGARVKYQHVLQGVNSRLDALQAAFLRVKLRHLDDWNDRRRALVARYLQDLQGSNGLGLPEVPDWATPVWHLLTVRHHSRDRLVDRLQASGIEALVHYPVPPHLSGAYATAGWRQGQFPVAEEIARTIVTLPVGPQLTPSAEAEVVAAVREFCDSEPAANG